MPFKIFSGDDAYPNGKYLVTPIKHNGRLTAAQRHYNKKVSAVRQIVERTIGRLENRFRRLKFIQCHTASEICHYIVAACVLQNLSQRSGGEVELDFSGTK